MFGKQQFRSRLSYGNVVASLALFVALGGTATAAITLPRDSVGVVQIRADAVRSPEIQGDAVRSPEIAPDAVRSSEIAPDAVRSSEIEGDAVRSSEIAPDAVRSSEIQDDAVHTSDIEAGAVHSSDILDETIVLADLAPGAISALDAPRVRVDERGLQDVALCPAGTIVDCGNLALVHLPAGRWLVQARFTINGEFQLGSFCALIANDSVPAADFAHNVGLGTEGIAGVQASLMAVVTGSSDPTTPVAVRCTREADMDLAVPRIVLTAVEVADG